jgi:hypothetical protein
MNRKKQTSAEEFNDQNLSERSLASLSTGYEEVSPPSLASGLGRKPNFIKMNQDKFTIKDKRPNKIEKTEVKRDFLRLDRSLTMNALPKYAHDQNLMRKHFCQIVGPDLCHVCAGTKERNKLTLKNETKNKTENLIGDSYETQSLPIVSYNLVESEFAESKANYKLMALILKNKYAIHLDEKEIEKMLATGVISSDEFDRSQMFIADGLIEKSDILMTKSETERFNENQKNKPKLFSFPTVLDNVEELKKFQVTEYFFTNLDNLKTKIDLKRNPKVLISTTTVPETSNKMFSHLERFEKNLKYTKMTKKAPLIDIELYNLKPTNNNFEKLEFLSSRKVHTTTKHNPKFYEPTVINMKAQRINKMYDRRNHVLAKIDYKKDFSFIGRKMHRDL